MICQYCEEAIIPGEPVFGENMHRECAVRIMIGSAAHQMRLCSCYGGTHADPPELSPRQRAALAWETFQTVAGRRRRAELN